MLGSIHLGTVLGIHVRMHWLFAVFVGGLVWLAAVNGMSPFVVLTYVGALFGLVFLHELGHSLVARHFGIRVLDITFWPLGGMARMSEIPENPRVEGWIAIAGPAVNLALAFLAAPILFWSRMAVDAGAATPFVQAVAELSSLFVGINLLLGLFNLVPAFPMDGGRLLRAWLGRGGDWVAATRTAVRVGRWFAGLMIAAGLFLSLQGVNLLPLVGLFVWFSGSRELAVVQARRASLDPLAAAFGFGPGAEPAAPPPAVAAPRSSDPSGARRPLTPLRPQPRSRISAEELERLEHHPGSVWRPRVD